MGKRNYHVAPYRGVWVLTRDGRPQPVSWCNSEEEAIETARDLAWHFQSDVVIHDPKQRIVERHTPNP